MIVTHADLLYINNNYIKINDVNVNSCTYGTGCLYFDANLVKGLPANIMVNIFILIK